MCVALNIYMGETLTNLKAKCIIKTFEKGIHKASKMKVYIHKLCVETVQLATYVL